MLCGSNVFAVGLGKKRFLIDACQNDQEKFLRNIEVFMNDQDCYFEGVLITHSHFDHFGGAYDIVKLMEKLGKPIPKIYKKIDGNKTERKQTIENESLK